MKYILYIAMVFLFLSCGNGGGNVTVETLDGAAYQMEAIPGQATKIAKLVDGDGNIIEYGQVDNGVKVGTWLTYEPGKEFPAKIETYAGGVINGPYFELNERGQVTLKAFYKNNSLHGPWGKYKFGRTTESAEYKDGQLDGVYKSYYQRDGKLQKEFHYKGGQLDGPYRFYNEEGEITLEYTYKNGEKVGGGIVDPNKENAPK